MYDPILVKSFSRYDRRRFRFGCLALLFSFILSLTICSTFKPSLHSPRLVGDAASLHLSISAIEEMRTDDAVIVNSSAIVSDSAQSVLVRNETELPRLDRKGSEADRTQIDRNMQDIEPLNRRNELVSNGSEGNPPQFQEKLSSEEPLCRVLKSNADYCEIQGDVRVDPNSSTIFLVRPRLTTPATRSWIIEPYPRKGTGFVKKWTVKIAADDDSSVPKCGESHSQPALLFSIGGFSGNYFHDFADLLVPLFTTSFRFKTEVQFLAADDDNKQWWLGKYRPLLNRLTAHAIVVIDREKAAHCYKHLIAGLQYYGEMVVDPASGADMSQFRQLLRRTYSLGREKAIQYTEGGAPRPRLMIVSRTRTRILTNEDQISETARKLGFEVVSGDDSASGNITEFAQVVNSCDVMMGVHGAGLTNMVFLPERAVLIQILPLGGIERFARLDFGNPAAEGMNMRYLEYQIEAKESSLIERYPIDHPIITDPKSIRKEGWGKLSVVYLDNQNVTIDVGRFRATLTKALELLRS